MQADDRAEAKATALQGPRRGNGARGQPNAAQSENKIQKGSSKSHVAEVQRPSTYQKGQGASQAQQSCRREDKPERGGAAVLEVCKTPNGHLKPQSQS